MSSAVPRPALRSHVTSGTPGRSTGRRPPFASVLALLWLLPLAGPAPALAQARSGADPTLAARVDTIAARVLETTGVPSASIAVVQHGRLAYAHAYGAARLEPRSPATADMRYAIGSISKQFAASCILLLQQEGKLSLDDRVSRFLPDLAHADSVTLRELLSHTSGYQDYWPQDYVPPAMLEPVTPRAILDRWASKALDFAPGTRWQYSNTNYVIAGLIVQKVSGMPFFEFLRRRILRPLDLSSVVNVDAGHLTESDPTGYMRYGLGPLRPAPGTGKGWIYAMGELAMTPRDLAKWDESLIRRSLLKPASYRDLETEVRLKSGVGTGYGLGVDVGMRNGHRVISHTGEVSGFTASNLVFPDDSAAVVVLTNQDAASAAGLIANGIAGLLFARQDSATHSRLERARRLFRDLQQGRIDRSQLTADADAYFGDQALQDFQSSLGPLGEPRSFEPVAERDRGGMLERVYRVVFPGRTLRVWTYEMPNGKLEQYQVAPTQ
ncbi:MAG: serine hydrolase domain-containing protein [Candidatus Palauibacterales bacterium]|nr:serine hydrolase domain-containing protein [Candidatus Palauibacterales bacterium]MDP2584327.1 serine hydrolase domain-containing protein [Candidatus Palauibacterales bacterium]